MVDLIRVCSWCKHVVGDDNMPKPEQVTDPESLWGVEITHTKCQVCVDRDEELKALRAERAGEKKRKVSS